MTTEAGSETEVKEKAEESPAQPDQSETAKEESQEIANVEGEEKEKGKEKEKEGKEGKGITRYLPTWFKKQKSQSQTSPTKEVPATEEPVSKGVEGEEEPAPEVNGHAEEVEEKEEVKSEEVKEATQPESNSNVSADTEPLAKEEKVEDTTSKSPEKTKETADGEGAEEEEKKKEPEGHVEAETDGGENQTSIFQSPLRLVRKNKMKVVVCHVTLLDGTDFTCEVEQKRAKGQYLFFKVCEHLNLLEKDYFGLMYKDNHDEKCWLDPTKEIKRQIRSNNWQFAFGVKFYPPDPSQLTEDITRYLLCLQLREDVASGRLPCSFVTHALLGSYTLQAELGDHEPDQPRPLDFISQLTFAPNQNKEMEEKILELHKSHRGMTPAQADLQFLENAKKLSMYGVDLHHAKDSEAVDIMLGVCANGLLVYKDRLRINRFAWPKILKISYKRNNFYIKIRPGETEQFESTVGFKLQNHRSAKRLWKVCVENHSFFRLNAPEPPTKARFLTLGSKFRYSGRTQAQTRLASSLIDRPAPSFERTSSKRISRSLDGAPVISITEAGSETAENGRDHRLELHSDSKVSVPQTEAASADNTSSETKEPAKTTEVEIEETVVIQEVSRAPKPVVVTVTADPPAASPTEHEPQDQKVKVEEEAVVVEEVSPAKPEKASSDSESEEEAEYHPNVPASISQSQIPEGKEEEEQMKEEEEEQKQASAPVVPSLPVEVSQPASAPVVPSLPVEVSQPAEEMSQEEEESKKEEMQVEEKKDDQEEKESGRETEDSTDDPMVTPEEEPEGLMLPEESAEAAPTEEPEQPKMNGEASLVEVDPRPQVICCSEPPVVKTEMVTISDTFAAQKTEIATKEVPIVHTETKTITYEAAQLDGNGDGEPGVLMTAQTITSESLCTTTTTHITKTLKGGLSETRIEKRIVITGDCDIDHDQALAQAIKEAKEQHPDMSVTRVVVHKETELAEEED
ncbi:band 4.1-like protein 2 isoform X7 [Xiphophorus maculatus]|uniref:band 4.1-like protein 2 isoform X7 n=1 Tax=Xiphophorus maculatus TaxID=8083 RepID=UPI000C6E4EC4|nr:band 4.1-like protein 2 isoform X7 [Xiphophorus maculatus]